MCHWLVGAITFASMTMIVVNSYRRPRRVPALIPLRFWSSAIRSQNARLDSPLSWRAVVRV